MNDNLNDWGWNDGFQALFDSHAADGLVPGRVIAAHREAYAVATFWGERPAHVSGRHRHGANSPEDFPAVGDWVALRMDAHAERAVIHAVLPRRSRFARAAVGGHGQAQVVATNVDAVFLVQALNRDYNLRRLERYVAAAWESGAQPVVVLTKADLCMEAAERELEAAASAPGVPVHRVCALSGEGLESLAPYLSPGRTLALLGSSGAGKSTLLNALAGREVMETGDIRGGDDRGKHTTTRRELVRLDGGALLIDTPGMRELGLLDATEGVSTAFGDVEALAPHCRFHDCGHQHEPGCAVQGAIAAGELDADRLASYLKLSREVAHQARRTDAVARKAELAKWKAITKSMRHFSKG